MFEESWNTTMTRRPEEIFEEFFGRISSQQRAIYKGRDDLSKLKPQLRDQLRKLQAMFTDGLNNERKDVVGHVEHPIFHVYYIDSVHENAIAFSCGGFSFIGITVALIYAVSDVCVALSKSQEVATLLRVQTSEEEFNNLQAVLFYIVLAFIAGHEWTHHVHGHEGQFEATAVFSNEILDAGEGGNIASQIKEIDADCHSTYYVLANLHRQSSKGSALSFKARSGTDQHPR